MCTVFSLILIIVKIPEWFLLLFILFALPFYMFASHVNANSVESVGVQFYEGETLGLRDGTESMEGGNLQASAFYWLIENSSLGLASVCFYE